MIQTVKVPNFNAPNLLEKTQLKADAPAGVDTVSVVNNEGLVAGFAVLGNPGAEPAELVSIQATSGSNVVDLDAATGINHVEYETLQQIYGDKVQLYRAPNDSAANAQPADTEFMSVGSPVTIQVDKAQTPLEDADGGSEWWYKYTYFNSASSSETDLSASKAARGGGGTNYCSIQAIRHEAGFDNAEYITDADIDDKRQAAKSEIDATLAGVYTIPFQVPINAFIVDINVRLAAGLLLTAQYTAIHTMQNSDGDNRVKGARADLQALALKQKTLTDNNGTNLSLPGSSGGFSAWPNADTAGSPRSHGGAPRVFRMGDIQGYNSRKY